MIEITSQNAPDYLLSAGRSDTAAMQVRELPGGVSNVVLLITPQGGEPFVLKQARGRLRVKDEWLCPVERIWREVEVLRLCGQVLGIQNAEFRTQNGVSAGVPRLLWEDRENYLYAMTAAPAGHRTWKDLLLKPEAPAKESPSLALQASANEKIAVACGELLARLHGQTWGDAAIAGQLDDRSYFEQLRLDPYYRQIARVHPDLSPHVQRLIDSVWQHRRCLVHGDYSPKNLLVARDGVAAYGLTLIDFEVGHFGDPAFDLGFFLTHLVLKAFWAGPRREEYLQLADAFWSAYATSLARTVPADELADLERRMLLNLAGCLLARVDGKSPVDYLSSPMQAAARDLGRGWLREPPRDWDAAMAGTLH
jgi:aminoglycoside phosphotransferase (APT) family kinase protein